jgi:hypothetical protein
MLSDAKVLYASVEAQANTNIKQEEDLTMRICTVDERDRVVEELEQKDQERKGLDGINLERDLKALATSGSSIDSCEANLEIEWKALEDACLEVTAHELASNIKERNLNNRVVELAEREKRLVKRQMQELAVA